MTWREAGIEHKSLGDILVASVRCQFQNRRQLRIILADVTRANPADSIAGPAFCIFQFVSSVREGFEAEAGFPVRQPVETAGKPTASALSFATIWMRGCHPRSAIAARAGIASSGKAPSESRFRSRSWSRFSRATPAVPSPFACPTICSSRAEREGGGPVGGRHHRRLHRGHHGSQSGGGSHIGKATTEGTERSSWLHGSEGARDTAIHSKPLPIRLTPWSAT